MIDRHAAHPGLDQAAGHQAALAQCRATVGIAQFVFFLMNIERLFGQRRGHQVHRPLGEYAKLLRAAVGPLLGALLESVHILQ